MATTGFKLVRYADDPVILCDSLERAKAALAWLQKWLSERDLSLNPQKTRIANLAEPGDGFDFLGYHFTRGLTSEKA